MKDSLIKKSGQMWKVYIFFISVLSAGVAFLTILYNESISLYLMFILVSIVTIGSLCMLYCILSIRCPYCDFHLPQYYLSKEEYSLWLIKLLTSKKCPNCNKGVSA